MIRTALDFCENALAAATPAAASDAFHAAIAPAGVSYMQVRRYRRPAGRLNARAHWDAGGFVARYARPGWIGSESSDYVCFECNPLLEPVATGVTRFNFGDYAPHADRHFGAYWDAMSEGDIAEAAAAVAYGRGGRIASLHVGFAERTGDQKSIDAVHMAATLVAEKLLTFDVGDAEPVQHLSARERDAIAFVAEGKTDWEIAQIMCVAETTARFHVDNARRKLGAVNRAHAVARFMATQGLF